MWLYFHVCPSAILSWFLLWLSVFTVLHVLAIHHWPQPGGLAYSHDQAQGSCDHPGVVSLCHPSCRHILGGGPPCQLLSLHANFLSAALCFLPPRRGPDGGHRAAVIDADVPPLVLGAQNHPAAQQSAAECLLQEHRLAQQHQLHLPLCSQGTDEQIPGAHAAGLHPLLLAHSVLDAYSVWEVGKRTEECNQWCIFYVLKHFIQWGLDYMKYKTDKRLRLKRHPSTTEMQKPSHRWTIYS